MIVVQYMVPTLVGYIQSAFEAGFSPRNLRIGTYGVSGSDRTQFGMIGIATWYIRLLPEAVLVDTTTCFPSKRARMAAA